MKVNSPFRVSDGSSPGRIGWIIKRRTRRNRNGATIRSYTETLATSAKELDGILALLLRHPFPISRKNTLWASRSGHDTNAILVDFITTPAAVKSPPLATLGISLDGWRRRNRGHRIRGIKEILDPSAGFRRNATLGNSLGHGITPRIRRERLKMFKSNHNFR
jgi:hypothetical protein